MWVGDGEGLGYGASSAILVLPHLGCFGCPPRHFWGSGCHLLVISTESYNPRSRELVAKVGNIRLIISVLRQILQRSPTACG